MANPQIKYINYIWCIYIKINYKIQFLDKFNIYMNSFYIYFVIYYYNYSNT